MTDRHGKVQAPARVAVPIAVACFLVIVCGAAGDSKLARYEAEAQSVKAHIVTFDELDFDVFTHQKWDRLHESHSKDVLVHWPDGHTTQGIERHIEDLKAMFVYAPDTKPMPTADGKSIAPTGKPFKLAMCTVGHWKGGVMDEEYLFWDNQAYMKQIGLAP